MHFNALIWLFWYAIIMKLRCVLAFRMKNASFLGPKQQPILYKSKSRVPDIYIYIRKVCICKCGAFCCVCKCGQKIGCLDIRFVWLVCFRAPKTNSREGAGRHDRNHVECNKLGKGLGCSSSWSAQNVAQPPSFFFDGCKQLPMLHTTHMSSKDKQGLVDDERAHGWRP